MTTIGQLRNNGRGLNFDGVDDYVEVPDNASLDISPDITIEAIITPESTTDPHGCICTKGASYFFQVMDTGLLACYTYWDNAGSRGRSAYFYSNTSLTWGQKYHVAFVEEGGIRRLYIDGVLDAEGTFESGIFPSNNDMRIGKEDTTGRALGGKIHEVRLWNLARTQAQIRNGIYGVGGSETGLVSYWLLNEGTGTTATDITGTNNGAISGAIWVDGGSDANLLLGGDINEGNIFTSRTKKYPTDSDDPVAQLADVDGNQIFNYGRDWHISVWDADTNDWATGINFYGATQVDGAHARFDVYADTTVQAQAFVDTLQNLLSTHIVVIGASHAPERYTPAMVTEILNCGGTTEKMSWTTREMYILVGRVNSGEGNGFAEALSNMDPSLNGGSTWSELTFPLGCRDSVSFRSDGDVLTEFSEVPDALSFDGVGDYIRIPNHSSLQITGDITIEVLMKPTNVSASRQNPINKAYGGEFTWTQETAGGMNMYSGTSGGNSSPYEQVALPSGSIIDNEIVHVTYTRDSVNLKAYKDGELLATKATEYYPTTASTADVLLGAGYVNNWYGVMYEVRIWNIVRTQQQIKDNMNSYLTGNETGLVGLWRLDEGAGLSVGDATPNGNGGDLNGDPAWVYSHTSDMWLDGGTLNIKGELIEGVDL